MGTSDKSRIKVVKSGAQRRPARSDHTLRTYVRGEPAPIVFELSSHRGSWVVLFFYPGDFTLVCPTELAAFAKRHDDFIPRGAVVLAASTNQLLQPQGLV